MTAQRNSGGGVLLEAALAYAARGWLVFPCVPGTKRPATVRGFLEATTDAERIRQWWAKDPTANVAIRTGRESGIVVLDVDPQSGGFESLRALERAHERLPDTRSANTPRGGLHFYFLHPGVEVPSSVGKLAPGLDIKGDGGYVLAPPSRTADGSYEWR
jgi:hypothetical protein